MRLPKPFRKQDKQDTVSYSAVNGDADSLKPVTDATNHTILPSGWPTDAAPIARDKVWLAVDCLLLILPVAFIG